MKNSKLKYQIYLIVAFLCFGLTHAQEIPPVPKIQTSVYDGANLMTGAQQKALEQKLINYADSTSTQIVVATVNTIGNNEISMYATKWAHKWGVGQKDKDNGVFVLVAKNDRKMTIQTGYGTEHLLTDALSSRIIRNVMAPNFREGNFYKGLDDATNVMIAALNGEYVNDNIREETSEFPIGLILFIIFIILMIILSKRNRGGGNYNNRGGRRRDAASSILEAIILSNSGRSGGFGGSSGGSFGGGGFGGGFGGGGFGGGGASGGW